MKTIQKIISLLILLMLLITLIACSKQNSDIDKFIQKDELERVVSEAMSKFPFGTLKVKAAFEAHEIVGKELKNDILNVYVVGYAIGICDDNKESGGVFPARLKIQKVKNDYKVIEYKDALASTDVYDFMPKKYAKLSINYDTSSLHEKVDKQVKEWQKNNTRGTP